MLINAKSNLIMKKTLLFILLPVLSFRQIKIGADIDGEPTASHNGRSVSLSSNGTTLAIGAPGNDCFICLMCFEPFRNSWESNAEWYYFN